ncbi:hypothetical protein [Heliorestis acidaminivorans]|uniref:hypothetical protein n=1 Tax=Heliorestis acidaminivorans TaxID=553427 RepID=UPI001FAB0EC6|nr:hypothetical protein [Heliorestis acidaminivorans]
MSLLFLILLPIALFIIIALVIAGVKAKTEEGGDELIKKVYIYVVLFATLMMTIGGSVGTFMALADLISPQPYHQSYEDFLRWGNEKRYVGDEFIEEPKLTEEELRARYEAMVIHEQERQMARAKNSLIKSLGWIVIPLPIFLYFQRRLAQEKN